MQAAPSFPNLLLQNLRDFSLRFLPRLLQNFLPPFLTTSHHQFDRPLLSQTEIRDLHLRVLSRKQKPATNPFDTAQQRMGDRRSIYRGYGIDYEESRIYQPGDDPRYMNWALTARSGELHMKVFREERRPGVFIVVDRRTSMRFGTRTRLKAAQAARVATCLIFSALQRHTAVGGLILNADNKPARWMKESDDEQDAFAFIHAASAACPPPSFTPAATQQESHLGDVLSSLQALITPGTQLYLISDFIDLTEQHRAKLLHLAAENPLHAITISDPAEHHLPKIGNAQFFTSDTGQSFTFNTDAAEVQAQYAAAAEDHFTQRKQLFRSLGITTTSISSTDDDVETILAES